jgi:hypothetical protein
MINTIEGLLNQSPQKKKGFLSLKIDPYNHLFILPVEIDLHCREL